MTTDRVGRGRRLLLGSVTTLGLAFAAVSCGGGSGDPGPPLSEAGTRGKQVALSSGCAGCHGPQGQGGVGPTWQGLAGSDVELADGSIIVADDEYLARSITDPGADLLADYAIQMPRNNLNDAQVADVVAYINDLADVEPDK